MASILAVLILGELLVIFKKDIDTNAPVMGPEIKKYLFPVVLSVTAFFIFLETSRISGNYASDAQRSLFLNTNDIEIGEVLIDHGLRYESNPEYFIKDIETDDVSVEVVKKQGFRWSLRCKTEDAQGAITLPLTNYKGYRIIDEYGQEYNIYENWNKEIGFIAKPDFDGIIYVFFQPKWYWTASAAISILYFLLTALSCAGINRTRGHGQR